MITAVVCSQSKDFGSESLLLLFSLMKYWLQRADKTDFGSAFVTADLGSYFFAGFTI
jgi:hypothetical protein